MFKLLRQFRRNQSGAAAIEYAMIVALVSVIALTAWSNIGKNINNAMTTANTNLSQAGIK